MQPVSQCFTVGATTIKYCETDANVGKELMAERCSGLFFCGIEMISTHTLTRSSGTSACSDAARTACFIATMCWPFGSGFEYPTH